MKADTSEQYYDGRSDSDNTHEVRKPGLSYNRLVTTVAGAAAVGVIALAGIGIYATHKNVTVIHDGTSQTLSTWHYDPSAVVKAANFDLQPRDEIHVKDGVVRDGAVIQVKRAHTVTVRREGKPSVEWTTAESTKDLVAHARKPVSVPVPKGGSEVPIVETATTMKAYHDGTSSDITVKPGESIRDALQAQDIEVSALDRVAMETEAKISHGSSASPSSPVIRVSRVERDVEEEKIVTKKKVEEKKDSSMYKGEKKVVEKGHDGVRIKRTLAEKVEGEQVHQSVISNDVVTEMKTEVVKVGSKKPPAGYRPGAGGSGAGGSGGGAHYSGDGVWGALAKCESGGNPRSVGSGVYGLYQFNPGTWRSVGGKGMPHQASPEEQLKRAKILQKRSGWGQWPACSRKIGVR